MQVFLFSYSEGKVLSYVNCYRIQQGNVLLNTVLYVREVLIIKTFLSYDIDTSDYIMKHCLINVQA